MSGLLKVLAIKKRDVKTGTVTARQANGYYQIRTGGRTMKIKSAMNEALPVGAGVVVTDTEDGSFIIAREKMKSRSQKEVTING